MQLIKNNLIKKHFKMKKRLIFGAISLVSTPFLVIYYYRQSRKFTIALKVAMRMGLFPIIRPDYFRRKQGENESNLGNAQIPRIRTVSIQQTKQRFKNMDDDIQKREIHTNSESENEMDTN